jgi:hypothetical protein
MSAHNTIRRIGLAGLVVLGAQLALAAGPAAAFLGYTTVPSAVFGASGSGNGQFSSPAGVAVDDFSGDVYVVDQGNNRVQKFDAEGNYIAQFNGSGNPSFPEGFSSPSAVAVDNSTGPSKDDVYVIDKGHNVIDKLSSTGAFVFELKGFASAAIGVAVDPSGDVWVGEESGSVQEFSSAKESKLLASLTPAFGRSPGIAVDSEENLYLVRGVPVVAKFNKAGETLAEEVTSCACTTGLAIDPATNGLFVDQGTSIARYGPFGEPYGGGSLVQTFGSGSISSSEGIAVNGTTHSVYASEREAGTVAIFKVVQFPDVTTGAASAVQGVCAKLEGVVNPDGEEVTSCQFEYGTSLAYGHTAACVPAPGSGSSPVAVSAQVAGPPLRAGSLVVHYRLKADNSNGVNLGADRTFETEPFSPPVAGPLPASNVSQFSATLNGTLETGLALVNYHFEYGTSTAYGQIAPIPDNYTPITAETVPVSQPVGSLQAGTTYHYRLMASSPGGTEVMGPDETFTTLAIPAPSVGTGAASAVTHGEALLSGTIDPEGWSTSYEFQYGATTAYGQSWPTVEVNLGAFTGAQPVSVTLLNLQPGTTYHYRLLASNGGGTSYGADGTFTTAEYPASIIQETPILGGPAKTTTTKTTTKRLTNAQKLTKALKACHKDKNKGKRKSCEKQARKSYGPVRKTKKK